MNCTNCGKRILENSNLCMDCNDNIIINYDLEKNV